MINFGGISIAMYTAITLVLVLLSGLLYVSTSESDTSDHDTNSETSEDEDGIAVDVTTVKIKTTRRPLRTTKTRHTTTKDKDAGVPLYRPNATERERINKQYEAWLSATNPPPKIKKPEPKGPFYGFIKNICNVTISRFSRRKITKFLKVLAKKLKGVGSGFTMKRWVRKFRKRIRLCASKPKILAHIVQFCNYTTEPRQFKDMFFNTINPIFSVNDDNRFDDYVYDLKRFGANRLRYIEEKTRYIFARMQKKLIRQKESVRENIQLQFDLLLIEYHDLKKKGVVQF